MAPPRPGTTKHPFDEYATSNQEETRSDREEEWKVPDIPPLGWPSPKDKDAWRRKYTKMNGKPLEYAFIRFVTTVSVLSLTMLKKLKGYKGFSYTPHDLEIHSSSGRWPVDDEVHRMLYWDSFSPIGTPIGDFSIASGWSIFNPDVVYAPSMYPTFDAGVEKDVNETLKSLNLPTLTFLKPSKSVYQAQLQTPVNWTLGAWDYERKKNMLATAYRNALEAVEAQSGVDP
jgi:hypothetical protein